MIEEEEWVPTIIKAVQELLDDRGISYEIPDSGEDVCRAHVLWDDHAEADVAGARTKYSVGVMLHVVYPDTVLLDVSGFKVKDAIRSFLVYAANEINIGCVSGRGFITPTGSMCYGQHLRISEKEFSDQQELSNLLEGFIGDVLAAFLEYCKLVWRTYRSLGGEVAEGLLSSIPRGEARARVFDPKETN